AARGVAGRGRGAVLAPVFRGPGSPAGIDVSRERVRLRFLPGCPDPGALKTNDAADRERGAPPLGLWRLVVTVRLNGSRRPLRLRFRQRRLHDLTRRARPAGLEDRSNEALGADPRVPEGAVDHERPRLYGRQA